MYFAFLTYIVLSQFLFVNSNQNPLGSGDPSYMDLQLHAAGVGLRVIWIENMACLLPSKSLDPIKNLQRQLSADPSRDMLCLVLVSIPHKIIFLSGQAT